MPKKAQTSTLENFFVSEGHRVLYNEITYLKKRIHLVEGERKANYESNEDIIKKNETTIKTIKEKSKELKEKRKCMVETRSNYFKKIAEVIGGEKKAYEFKDKNYREVVDILEYKIGALRNKMNIVDYKRLHYMNEMNEALQLEENLRKKLEKRKGHSDPRVEDLKATETSTAAMQMKTTEAENVRARYKHMLRVLRDENFTQCIKLADLEKNIEKQGREIIRIETVLQDANRARKSARTHLTQVEQETIEEFQTREQELYEARMKLKIIRDKMESIGSKLQYPKFHIIHRDSSITDGLFPSISSAMDKGEGGKSQTTLEAVYNELQELIGESDPNVLVERFEKQRQQAKDLVKEEQTMKSAVRKAKLRKRFLADRLGQMQYSGGLRREELNVKSDAIGVEMTSTTSERDRLDNMINEQTVMLEQMLSKLTEICHNNHELKLSTILSDSVGLGSKCVTILKHILQKSEQAIQLQEQQRMAALQLLSPASAMATTPVRRHTNAGDHYMRDGEEEGGATSTSPTPHRFGSTGDISYGGKTDTSGGELSSRKPSIADLTALENNNMGMFGNGPAVDRLTLDVIGGVQGVGTAAVSPLSMADSTAGFQLQLPIPGDEEGQDADDGEKQVKPSFSTKGQDSSEEEEAVTRNFLKRQSQVLFEAKTRKGRFNPNAAPTTRHRRV